MVYICKVVGIDEDLLTHSDKWDSLYRQFISMVKTYISRNSSSTPKKHSQTNQVACFKFSVLSEPENNEVNGTVIGISKYDIIEYIRECYKISNYSSIKSIEPTSDFTSNFTQSAKLMVLSNA